MLKADLERHSAAVGADLLAAKRKTEMQSRELAELQRYRDESCEQIQ